MNLDWVDKGLIGGHQFLPRRWNPYVSSVLFFLVLHPIHGKKKPLDPSNDTPMKIYTCYDNLPAQQWYYTNDKRIVLGEQGRKILDANEKTE